jgi:DNA-binding transcriptional regulator YiaG
VVKTDGKGIQMKKRVKRNAAQEIIADLKEMHATLKSGTALQRKYTVRTVHTVPDPATYDAAAVRSTRALVGVSQPVFARMLGVSPALVRSWECGQRKPAPIARRLLDQIRAAPSSWRAMVEAA